MAATIPYQGYGGLVWNPKDTHAPVSKADLHKMRFDNQHFLRAYNQCRGRGQTPQQCIDSMPIDTHFTPQNPFPTVFTKDVVDAVECMSDYGDVTKCNHFMEGMYNKTRYEPPAPTKFQKFGGALTLMGGFGTFTALALVGLTRVVKLKF